MCRACGSWVGMVEGGFSGDLHIWCDTCKYDIILEFNDDNK